MPIFILEEDPELYLAVSCYGDHFRYTLSSFDAKEARTIKYTLSLKIDKLMIHGTQIEEFMSQKLYESLTFKQKAGIIYVNCNGACYIQVDGRGYYRPIRPFIFDWSSFGVTVPNSVNDILRKRVSTVEGELSSCMAECEASKNEVEVLKAQLLACQKDKQISEEKLLKVKKLQHQFCLWLEDSKDSELVTSKKRVMELEEELSTCKNESSKFKIEQRKMKDEN